MTSIESIASSPVTTAPARNIILFIDLVDLLIHANIHEGNYDELRVGACRENPYSLPRLNAALAVHGINVAGLRAGGFPWLMTHANVMTTNALLVHKFMHEFLRRNNHLDDLPLDTTLLWEQGVISIVGRWFGDEVAERFNAFAAQVLTGKIIASDFAA